MVRKKVFLGLFLVAVAVARCIGGSLWLTWDYPQAMPASNIVFVVLRSTNAGPVAGFQVWTNVAAPPVAIAPGKGREFFLCYASNTLTHMVSGFNVRTNRN